MESTIAGLLAPVASSFAVAIHHPERNKTVLINESEVFRSASVIKVPILVEVFCQRDEGQLSLNETVVLEDSHKVDGSGVLKEIHAGAEFTLLDLATLMTVVSDNTATNLIIDRVGMEAVNKRLRSLGLQDTVLGRKMYDFEAAERGHDNLCTAADMMQILTLMLAGKISSNSTSLEMLEIMARQQCRDKIPLLLPEEIRVANKTGSLTGITHDVGIVYSPSGPYVLCVLTKGVSDRVAADRAIAEVSKSVYGYFCS